MKLESQRKYSTEALKSYTCISNEKFIGAKTVKQYDLALASIQRLTIQQTNGLPASIELQKGTRYMITNNVDVSDGLFNGASGILRKINLDRNRKINSLLMEFDDKTIGTEARRKLKVKTNSILVPIEKIQRPINRPSSITVQVNTYKLKKRLLTPFKSILNSTFRFIANNSP